MTNLWKIIVKKILEKYHGFQGITTLVDVGGGYGGYSQHHHSIKGINYDLPHVEVLHNWDDEHCLKLLRNCYEALEEKGKVIVISYMMSEEAKGNAAKFISQMDLHIATGFRAKQF
ncbi:hypothetical protein Gotri_004651, partial [Gossypium trilobum]|nr:hypothetical protein [Gossypium trilobum]